MNAMVNRPTKAQATMLRKLVDGLRHRRVILFSERATLGLCEHRGWWNETYGVTVAGKAALLAWMGYPLTEAEERALTALLRGPLLGALRFWTPEDAGTPRVTHATIENLHRRMLVHKAPLGAEATITCGGLDALGVIAPVPLPEGETYQECTGPKVYGWHGTPAPGWRPGLAAPDVGDLEAAFRRSYEGETLGESDPSGARHAR